MPFISILENIGAGETPANLCSTVISMKALAELVFFEGFPEQIR